MSDSERDDVLYKVQDEYELIGLGDPLADNWTAELKTQDKIIPIHFDVCRYTDLGDLTLCELQSIPPKHWNEESLGANYYLGVGGDVMFIPAGFGDCWRNPNTIDEAFDSYMKGDGVYDTVVHLPIKELLKRQVDYSDWMSSRKGQLVKLTDGNTYVFYGKEDVVE